jgi:hypothetical protein
LKTVPKKIYFRIKKKPLIPFFGEISPVKRKGCWGKYPSLNWFVTFRRVEKSGPGL